MNMVKHTLCGLVVTLAIYGVIQLLAHHDVYRPIARHSLAYL